MEIGVKKKRPSYNGCCHISIEEAAGGMLISDGIYHFILIQEISLLPYCLVFLLSLVSNYFCKISILTM